MNRRWQHNPVKLLHIELSSHCNAACPFCPRFLNASRQVRTDLRLQSISLEDFKKWFPPKVLREMSRILYCGTHGDPMMAKDAIEIFKYVSETNPNIWQFVHTNGGLRKPEWWAELGTIFNKKNMRVTFSIDGLEDTNHIYRRNVKWDLLMANVKAYLDAGGRGLWEFLVFKHNEHQLEESDTLSKQLGFSEIVFKRPLGFNNLAHDGLRARGAYDKNGVLEYKLYPATNEDFVNNNMTSKEIEDDVVESFDIKEMQDYKIESMRRKMIYSNESRIPKGQEHLLELDEMVIDCKSHSEEHGNEVYVSSNGILYPCCYVGTRVDSDIDLYEDVQLRSHLESAGFNKFSLKSYTLSEIVESGVLDHVFTNSWNLPSITCGKMAYCAQTCGAKSEVDRIY